MASVLAFGVAVATMALLSGDSSTDSARVASPSNPMLGVDFPDPHVVRTSGAFFAFATNGVGGNVQVAAAKTLDAWELLSDALPERPVWMSEEPTVWAPAVARIASRWVLYVSGPDRASGRQCIGVALSDTITGPYRGEPDPIVCQTDLGGSIDPFVFGSEGRHWLLWKNDGNCCGLESFIWSQPLDAGGLAVTGEATRLITVTESWERGADAQQTTIENPAMFRDRGTLFLTYSANGFATGNYAVGYATCETPAGPCAKPQPSTPLLASNGAVAGPGGASVFTDRLGERWLAYHAWSADAVGYEAGGRRTLRLDRVEKRQRGQLVTEGPTVGDHAGDVDS